MARKIPSASVPSLLGGTLILIALLIITVPSIGTVGAAPLSGRGVPAAYQPDTGALATSVPDVARAGLGDAALDVRPGRGQPVPKGVAGGQDFQDVPTSHPFFSFLHNIYSAGIVSGYDCGGPTEPCGNPPLPYYRPNNSVTRAQMTKYVDLARHAPGIAISTIDSPLPLASDSDAPAGTGVYGTTAGTGAGRGIDQVNAGLAGYAFGPYAPGGGSVGVVAYSANDTAAWIATGAASNTYGLYVSQGGALFDHGASTISNTVYINGPLVVTGPKTGYIVDIMRNNGSADLQPGDVVVAGTAAAGLAQVGQIPVANVVRSHTAYDTGVLGVVDMRWIPGDPQAPAGTAARTGGYDPEATMIHPGEYMGVVTLGLYKGVQVDASTGPIHTGDLLTTSSAPGSAMKATDKLSGLGAVVGKAMGDLESGTGMIPVMVTLR